VETGRLVSDRERESAVDRLRVAHAEGVVDLDEFADRVGIAYGARTDLDLARAVVGLPDPPPPPVVPPARAATTRWVVGVLSGARRRGPWRPDQRVRAVAVLGSAVVDLTEVDLSGLELAPDGTADLDIVAVAVLGGVEVLVPEGLAVDLGGVAVLGSKDRRVRAVPPLPGTPVVRVRARAVLGGVTVRSHPFRRGIGPGRTR
jgi:hypothetical protein